MFEWVRSSRFQLVLIAGGSGLIGVAATWWTLQSGVKDETATAWGPNIAVTAFALTLGVLAVEPIIDRAQERQEARRWGKQVRDLMLWVDVGIRIAGRGMASLSDEYGGHDLDIFSEQNMALQAEFDEYAKRVIGNLQTEIESVFPVLVMTSDGLDAYKLLHRVLQEFKNPLALWRREGTWIGVEETSDNWREWLNKQGLSDIPAELDRTHATTRETKREDQDDYLQWVRPEEGSLGISRVRTPLEGGEPVWEARVGSEASALELLRSLPTGAGVAAVWDALEGWGKPAS